jgi:hypothetical protein
MDAVFSPALLRQSYQQSNSNSSFWIVLATSMTGLAATFLLQTTQSFDTLVQLATLAG